jgi:hypothetical protein
MITRSRAFAAPAAGRVALVAALALACSLGAGRASAAVGESGAPYGVAAPLHVHHLRLRAMCPPPTHRRPECAAVIATQVAAGTPGSLTYATAGHEEGPKGGITPKGLATAYEYSPTESGYGQTIALMAADNDPALEESLATFSSYYGIAACTEANGCFKRVSSTGGSPESLPAMSENEAFETTLDIEAARSVCQRCKIDVVETHGSFGESVDEAVKPRSSGGLGATVVSSSYSYGGGSGEGGEYETPGDPYNHPGVVIINDAGDWGYDTWSLIDGENSKTDGPSEPGEQVEAPGVYPYVVSVGGTTLEVNEAGARTGEAVWDEPGIDNSKGRENTHKATLLATDGGCSPYVLAPSWQRAVPGWASTGCGEQRLANDVAALAGTPGFGIYDSYLCPGCSKAPEWTDAIGTSLAAPLIAGFFALAGGAQGVSYPAAILYSHEGEPGAFFNVTEGGDGYCGGASASSCGHPNSETLFGWDDLEVPGGHHHVDCEFTTACNAVAGYDGPTGVGTPKGLYGFRADAFTAVTQNTATIQWRVNPDGSNVSECKFEYGTTNGYGSTVACKKLPGSGDVPVLVSAAVTGLSPSTEYHFRLVTKNSNGTLAGPDIMFTTLAVTAPSVETKGAGGLGASSATLYASVNPRGGSVSACEFEYGTTTAYGSSVSCAALPGSGSSPVTVSASIASGLAADTEYHYRISATNPGGTSKGADATFKTS